MVSRAFRGHRDCFDFLFRRHLFAEDVWAFFPVLFFAVVLEIFVVVNPVELIVVRVVPLREEDSLMIQVQLLTQLSDGALFVF